MPVNINQFIAAGLDRIEWGVIASDGYLKGTAGTLANGADAGMGRLIGSKTADYQIPELERVNITGDDKRQGTFQFDSVEASAFTLEVAASDFNFAAKSQSTLVRTLTDKNLNILRPGTRTLTTMAMLLISQAKSKASGSSGQAGFHCLLLPRVEVTYLGPGGFNERGERAFRYSAVVNPTDKWPWGEALAENVDGDTEADAVEFFAENRVSMHTHVGDNADTALTLLYTPAAANGNKVIVWQDGVLRTYTTHYTVNTGTKVLTFVTAPGTGVVSVVLYEYLL